MPSDVAAQVFISYAEEDGATAAMLAHGLESSGFTTWYYGRDSVPGREHFVQSGAAIERASVCIILISGNALASHHVAKELERAYDINVALMPLLIGLSDADYKKRNDKFRHAIGAVTSIRLPDGRPMDVLPKIVIGLRSLGIEPQVSASSWRSGPPAAGQEQRRELQAAPAPRSSEPKYWSPKWQQRVMPLEPGTTLGPKDQMAGSNVSKERARPALPSQGPWGLGVPPSGPGPVLPSIDLLNNPDARTRARARSEAIATILNDDSLTTTDKVEYVKALLTVFQSQQALEDLSRETDEILGRNQKQ